MYIVYVNDLEIDMIVVEKSNFIYISIFQLLNIVVFITICQGLRRQ